MGSAVTLLTFFVMMAFGGGAGALKMIHINKSMRRYLASSSRLTMETNRPCRRNIHSFPFCRFALSIHHRQQRYSQRLLMVERNYAIESPKQLLSESQAKQELIRLDKEITYHDKLYYEKDSPTISDAVYDGLVNRAREIVRQFPLLHGIVKKLQNTVGSKKSSSFLPFHHSRPMLSLENGFLRDDLAKFVERVQKATTMIDPAKYEGSIQNDIHGNVEFIVEPKIDGLSLAVRYRGGVLLSAGTRGDGTEGEDVTSNALTIPNIPKKIDIEVVGKLLHDFVSESATEEEGDSISISAKNTNTIVEVRGEVYISKSDFEQLNSDRIASNQTRFSTPRNAAAGSLRQQDVSKAAERRLNFFAYALHIYEENSSPSSGVHIGAGNEAESSQPYSNHRNAVFIPASQSDTLEALSKLGFYIAQPFGISDDLDGVWRLCSNLEQERPKLDFDIDGAVVKVNNVQIQQLLGQGPRSPKWALAHKFTAEEAETELVGITVQVGRTGLLTPVAHLQPVMVGGVLVERVTLHNEVEVNRLGLRPIPLPDPNSDIDDLETRSKERQRVIVKRAGDVIPKIVRVVSAAATDPTADDSITDDSSRSSSANSSDTEAVPPGEELFSLPSSCPACGSPTVREPGGILVRCSGGFACEAQVLERMAHFCSRDAADIDGLGLARLEDLYQAGLLKSPVDVYRLHNLPALTASEKEAKKKKKTSTKTKKSQTKKNKNGKIAPSEEAIVPNDEAVLSAEIDTGLGTMTKDAVAQLRGRKSWGDKSVANMLASIESRRTLPMHKFLFGLGIRHVGQETARDISKKFGDFQSLWDYLKSEAELSTRAPVELLMPPPESVEADAVITEESVVDAAAAVETGEPSDEEGSKKKKKASKSKKPKKPKKPKAPKPIPIGAKLLEIHGLGGKAVDAMVEFARNPKSRELVDELLKEVTILPSPLFTVSNSNSGSESDVASVDIAGSDSSSVNSDNTDTIAMTAIEQASKGEDAAVNGKIPTAPTPPSSAAPSSPMKGVNVVFTGKLTQLTRSRAQEICQQLGAEVSRSMTSAVTLLVSAGGDADTEKSTSKLKKAKKSGIDIWDERTFMDFIKSKGIES